MRQVLSLAGPGRTGADAALAVVAVAKVGRSTLDLALAPLGVRPFALRPPPPSAHMMLARSGDDENPLVGPRVAARGAAQHARPFVMLVKDDPVVAQMYQMGLEAAGFVVMVVGDGSELFKALDLDIPDVVVLDWELPGVLTGVDIIDNLRLDDRTAQLLVIMLSNHSGDVDGAQDRALKAGAPWLLKVRTTPAQLADRPNQVRRRAVKNLVRPSNPRDPMGSTFPI